ncbi:MAG: hypothetical protein H6978_04895 [Gammaproteobacteria bacterium]|nr:hypothetical protein [Gammaproteobacteria bacterium]
MKLYSSDGGELLEVATIERDGNELVIKGKIFQSMPLSARVKPAEARKALRMLDLKTLWFIMTLPWRKAD